MAVKTYIMRENDYCLTEFISARFPDLLGKTAIITGVSRGIGCAIAYFLGRQLVFRMAAFGVPKKF